ncbi:MAG: RnfABCDGE type electron transport complex subunit D [Clostridia bacterium]|nr:RnfABCDGE type electron transport complex subunit D [Clostridia bacterium]
MNNNPAPHIRTEQKSRHMIMDVLIAASVLYVFSVFNYGMRPVYIGLLSILSSVTCEAICCLIRRRSLRTLLDGSAAVTGALIGLVMSPMVAYWVPMVGSAFAVLVVKAPFGGYGRNVFNPAAAGIALLSYCTPQRMFTYPAIGAGMQLPLDMELTAQDASVGTSLAAQIRDGATPTVNRLHLLLGDFVGPIGATATVILLACAAYFIIRRTASAWTILPYLITCVLCAWCTPCTGLDTLHSILAQMCAGYVLFAGVFLLNDPVTAPRFWLGRILYGVFAGALTMLLQQVGRMEAGSCFAILIVNALSPIIDRWSYYGWRNITRLLRIRREVKAHE